MSEKNYSERFDVDGGKESSRVRWLGIVVIIFITAVMFVCGLLIGHFCTKVPSVNPSSEYQIVISDDNDHNDRWTNDQKFARQILFGNIDNMRIKTTHKDLSSKTTLSGTAEDLESAKKLKDMWENAGLDVVRIQDYEVQLGYPNTSKPNRVSVMNMQNGSVAFESIVRETNRTEGDPTGDFVQPYLIYCKPGVVTVSKRMYIRVLLCSN
jgi:hypothetical protein